jgi:hypothetical protein
LHHHTFFIVECSDNALVSYLGGTWFESWLEHFVILFEVLHGFLQLLQAHGGTAHQLAMTASFHILSNLSFNHCTIQQCIV